MEGGLLLPEATRTLPNAHCSTVNISDTMSAASPSMDSYQIRLSQFYETMRLSAALGQRSLARRSRLSSDAPTEVNTQRRFLKNLAFVCDYRKDDSFKTSIAVESDGDMNRFWIAIDDGTVDNIARSLASILSVLKRILGLPQHLLHHGEDVFQGTCATFAKDRLRSEVQSLSMAVKDSQELLLKLDHPDLTDLPEWLSQFEPESSHDRNDAAWCRLAYEVQGDDAMAQLSTIEKSSDMRALTLPFTQIRYSIRRLATQFQTCKELIEDGAKLKSLLGKFHVRMVKAPEPVPPPTLDPNTNFDLISKRLIDTNPLRGEIEAAFLRLKESDPNIEEKIQKQYGECMPVPRVPCEVQMLEHFYKNQLKYSMGDTYIGISKPSCLCSQSYFQHHPAACVGLETSGKLCQSWGPPLVPGGRHDEGFILQHKLLVKVHSDIRQRVLQRLLQIDQLGVTANPTDRSAATGKSASAGRPRSEGEHTSNDDWVHVGYGGGKEKGNTA